MTTQYKVITAMDSFRRNWCVYVYKYIDGSLVGTRYKVYGSKPPIRLVRRFLKQSKVSLRGDTLKLHMGRYSEDYSILKY